ncbi:HupE/UreJ family protein [Spirosoma spitsbergense]|uniref:HupE/UreJ family protein n=1 Tax=Spirosoma spitsbergense TaxID=431554 RepID=UPI00035DBB35|nr:HupE/UreJ family protein [Spirosoma spitsbergense]
MDDFLIYLRLGFDHITDPRGYDHILFVIALCAVYTLQEWRQVLILVTAFTIGHSITLALATLQLIHYETALVELLIPITILVTAISNFFFRDKKKRGFPSGKLPGRSWRYGLALSFGLIHGMGFSNYLRSLLGREADIIEPLLAFNIGLEIGQLVIVTLILLIAYGLLDILKTSRLRWTLIVSGIVAGMALSLIINNAYLSDLIK